MGPPGRAFCTVRYPRSPTPYRYVNSGLWVGRAAAAYKLFTELVAYTPGLDDQHVVGHIFVDLLERFALDRRATLLQSMHGGGGEVRPLRTAEGAPVLRNALTNTSPVVLHFNGGAKRSFATYRDHLLSDASCQTLREYSHGSIHTPDGPLPFQKVCPAARFPLPRCTAKKSGSPPRWWS